MADANVFLKPDKILASLEAKLRKATGDAAIAIQKQIDARQAEISAEFGSVAFGSGGYVLPNYAYSEASGAEYGDLLAQQTATQEALAGKMQLVPSSTMYTDPFTGQTTNLNPIYQAQYYGPQGQTGYVKDPETGELVDQYEYAQKVTMAQLAGKMPAGSNTKTFYDETGKQLTADQVAKTAQGASFAKAGWDIGFGPGMIAPGVSAKNMSDDEFRGNIVNNLVASGEMQIPGYNAVTGTVTPTSNVSGTTNTTGTRTTSTASTSSTTSTVGTNNTPVGLTPTQYNDRISVYSAMADRFNKYGLTALANKIKELAIAGATEATITLQLQETPEYQQRFAANADRIKKGLAALTPAEYVNVEDSYRQVLRAYGLKQFDNDAYVKQFIANDMSPTELSNRVVTAVQRVQNADPALVNQLKQYYGIGAADMVAYVLDPEQQFQKIERQIAASEIGVAAARQGLQAGVSVAEQLAAQGVTEAEARKGYATIADILPTAEKLSDIYGTTLDEYRQAEGEQEVFNSLASAQRKRQKLTQRELAAFGGASGTNKTSLTTSAVGQF